MSKSDLRNPEHNRYYSTRISVLISYYCNAVLAFVLLPHISRRNNFYSQMWLTTHEIKKMFKNRNKC